MDYIQELVTSLKPLLENYGFRNEGLNWFYENESIIKIFNIQKSQFGKQFYLNIGIKIKVLESKITYSFAGSQVGTRLDTLVRKEILDFENDINNKVRAKEIIKMLNSNPYEFFTLTGEIESIKKFIIDSKSFNTVTLNAKKYLGINF
ncbi:MAG: DUF4304 domain-containing protein [Ignavibacteriaceae bacterium]